MSGSHKDETPGAGGKSSRSEAAPADRRERKHRPGDVGRALRSVYDDTLRESVPDDFMDLLGKLS